MLIVALHHHHLTQANMLLCFHQIVRQREIQCDRTEDHIDSQNAPNIIVWAYPHQRNKFRFFMEN